MREKLKRILNRLRRPNKPVETINVTGQKPKFALRKKALARLVIGLVLFYFVLMVVSAFFDTYRLNFQSPVIFQLPVIVQHRTPPGHFLIKKAHAEALVQPAPTAKPLALPTIGEEPTTQPPVFTALPVVYPTAVPTAAPTAIPTQAPVPQGSPYDIAKQMFIDAFGSGQWPSAEALINSESGFSPVIHNPSSGACGIGQALPCEKMGCNLSYSDEDIRCEVRWMIGYVRGTHGGTPASNWSFHIANNWY